MHHRTSTLAFILAACAGLLAVGCSDDDNDDVTNPSGREPAAFRVTAVSVVPPTPSAIAAECPAKVVFVGRITTDGPGVVSYEWISSDGRVYGASKITFEAAGTQEVVTSWTLAQPGDTTSGWHALRVTSPNTVESGRAEFTLNCAAPPQRFRVTSVRAVPPTPSEITTSCPAKVVFVGQITTDGPGAVDFEWQSSDGRVYGADTIKFPSAGTQEVVTSWTLAKPGDKTSGWHMLRVTSPNKMESERAEFTLNCNP